MAAIGTQVGAIAGGSKYSSEARVFAERDRGFVDAQNVLLSFYDRLEMDDSKKSTGKSVGVGPSRGV